MKKSHGTYKLTLYRLFFAIVLATSLIVCTLIGWFLNRQSKSDYSHYLEQSANSQKNLSSLSVNVIINAIGSCTKGDEITDWVDSESLPEFYFNAINASKRLQAATTDILQIEYQLAVAPLNPRAFHGTITNMVLTGEGSMDLEQYCRLHSIMEQDFLNLIDHFQESEDPVAFPEYDPETGKLANIQYIVKNKGRQHPYLFFVTIPIESLVLDPLSSSFFLYNESGIFAYSDESEESVSQAGQIYEQLTASAGSVDFSKPQEVQGQYLMVLEIPHLNWSIACQYPPLPLHIKKMMTFLLIVCLFIILALILSCSLVEILYHPVKELLESSPLLEKSGKSVNEFEIIRKNMEKITELGSRLHETMEENDSLMSIQCCKELLFSSKVSPDMQLPFERPDANYCVAIGETLCLEDDRSYQAIALQKGTAYDVTAHNPNLFYINLDYNRYALIIQTDSLENASEILMRILRLMEDNHALLDSDHRIVLSDIHSGIKQLHTCYQEALKILEFRFLHAKSRLITYREISSIDAVTYSYPLQSENKLIQCALEGKPETIEIFESIIRENIRDKDLSRETLQNLIYALIGTISRIFQEMKTSPEEFLGKKIDYRYLYNHWNDSAVFIEIKDILEAIIQTVRQRENSRDQELLNKMLGYIYKNYSDDIMLNDLADYLNISPKYCGILFKQLSDNNFKDFLNRYRIERSKEILTNHPSIKIVDLSAMVGFNSSNSFIRVFNKYVGITPKAYQDRVRQEQENRV